MRRWILFLFLPMLAWSSSRQTIPLRTNGSVPAWIVLGPFPNIEIYIHDKGCFGYHRDWLLALGGEENAMLDDDTYLEYEAGKTAQSQPVISRQNGLLNFPTIFQVDDYVVGVAYAYCNLISDRDQSVTLHIRSNDGVKAWLNHKLIHEHHVGRQVETEEDLVQVPLRKGENPFLLKVDQGGGKWQLLVTLTDAQNKPVAGVSAQIESNDRMVPATVAGGDYELESELAARTRPRYSISDKFSLFINGQLCSRDNTEYAISPGEPNVLAIQASDKANIEFPLSLELTRVRPDGRSQTEVVKLTAALQRASLDLGLFAVPAVFSYEAGAVYRTACRYHLRVLEQNSGSPMEAWSFYQTADAANSRDVLRLGDAERVAHMGWQDFLNWKPMDPPVLLYLDSQVLSHVDSVRVCYQLSRLRSSSKSKGINAQLRISHVQNGSVIWKKKLFITEELRSARMNVADWKAGEYKIELLPSVPSSSDHDGPSIVYRRTVLDEQQVLLSPLAPWAMRRDLSRPVVLLQDFRQAVGQWSKGLPKDGGWDYVDHGKKVSLVNTSGDWQRPPVMLQPGLKGWYALFATTHNEHCYIQAGKNSFPRGLGKGRCFVTAMDMTEQEVSIYPSIVPGSGLAELQWIPVTEESARAVMAATSNPPVALSGIADWGDYLCPPPIPHSAGGRLALDQYDALMKGHAELGLKTVAWAIGRSVIEYYSNLPNTTRFPGAPLEKITDPDERAVYAGLLGIINKADPLAEVLRIRSSYGVHIHPWLAMNRHYGTFMDEGIHTSAWFVNHPQYHRWHKNAYGPCDSEVEYYFPEVRKERADIFCEVAERQPDGVVVGACRQIPMASYHPLMVAEFKKLYGIDPLKIDGHNEKEYEQWIRWRAQFFTMMLRELKERLAPIRAKTGLPIPVIIRVPSKGLFINLAQGLDVETWCKEHLVDRIHLDPLEDVSGLGSHDVRPYVDLGRRYHVEMYGCVNGNTYWNYAVQYKRALGLLQAGVDGIELYESNNQCILSQERWTVPMFGNAQELSRFLQNSNIEACFPVWSRNAAAGHDNHSFGRQWSIYGSAGSVL
jgi:hypothetical protein